MPHNVDVLQSYKVSLKFAIKNVYRAPIPRLQNHLLVFQDHYPTLFSPNHPHPAPSAHRTILDMINMICQRVSDESWFKKVLSFRWNWWSLKKNLGSALKHITCINNHHTTSVETFPIQHDRSLQHYENPLPLPSFRNKRNSVSICVYVTAF